MAMYPLERHMPSAWTLFPLATNTSSNTEADVEKVAASPTQQQSSSVRLKSNLHRFCAEKAGWAMVSLLILLLLGLTAALCAIFLTGGGAWTTYKAWEKEHAYDSPIHPAMPFNFPDPAILYHKKCFYAFATNNASGVLFRPRNSSHFGFGIANIQLAVSKDPFKPWTLRPPAQQPLAHVGAWANLGMTKAELDAPSIPKAQGWAPGITQRESDGKFVLYYAAASTPAKPHVRPGHCIGAAVSESKSPLGPYKSMEHALICDFEHGGAIDPSPFVDKGGELYLAYKVDGNNIGHGGACGNTVKPLVPTPIMLQKMHKSGTSLDGRPVQMLDRKDGDGPLVEAPNIVRSKEGIYFLFFSSGCTRDASYVGQTANR